MQFTPKTEQQIIEEGLLPNGVYPFEITAGADTQSKAGNEMIVITIKVFKEGGGFILINDYLLEAMAHKLRHACEACSLLREYDSGKISGNDFVGKTGKLIIKIQKDKNGDFPDKNSVKDYVIPELDNGQAPTPPVKKDTFADDIPF